MEKKKKVKGFKKYLKDFLVFVKEHLEKKIYIIMVVAIVVSAISIKPYVSKIIAEECTGTCLDNMSLMSEYWNNLVVILITAFAGIVPYIYISVVGTIGYMLITTSTFGYLIKGYGYGKGILLGLVPYLLNVIAISIMTALGMYICKVITVKYRKTNLNNMNFLNFRIKAYEIFGKEEKQKKLNELKEKRMKKIEEKEQKFNWLQILNTTILVGVIQFIATLVLYIIV